MVNQLKQKNNSRNSFLKLPSSIPSVAEKFGEYYSDVYKERVIDYPIAVFSALVRISLYGQVQ